MPNHYNNLTRKFNISELGASKDPCSQNYAGPKPFSEPETKALAEFASQFDNIKLYMSFHGTIKMLLFPYVSVLFNLY